MKLLTVVGARPPFNKAAVFEHAIDAARQQPTRRAMDSRSVERAMAASVIVETLLQDSAAT